MGRKALLTLLLGLVLLGAAAAEAQTPRILVSNTGQGSDDVANTSGNGYAIGDPIPNGIAIAANKLTLNGATSRRPPVGPAVFTVSFPRGTQSSVTVPFCDADGQDLTYTATQADGSPLPDWLLFSSYSDDPFLITHAPDFDLTASDVTVTITATDPLEASTSVTFTVAVVDTGDPVFAAFAQPNCSATTPTVTGVALTSDPTNATYGYAIGNVIEATVTFSEAVDITGTPQLELDVAGTAKAAACTAATNTTTMACAYTVAVNDSAPNGIAIAANKLTGGTITATGSTTITAALDHAAVAIDAGQKIDGIRPTLVTTGSDAPTTSTDGTQVILTFSETISSVDRTKITIMANSVTAATSAASAAGTTVVLDLTTALTTTSTPITVELAVDAVVDNVFNGNLAVAATAVTNAVVSTTAPTVTAVALTSDPGSDNTYAIGDAVEATVTFDAAVDITGAPQLELDFAGTAKAAACTAATNTTTMGCRYTVAVGDVAAGGVAIAANKLTGGTITATGSTTINADLDHDAVAIDAGQKIDGIRPTLVTTGSDAPTTSTDGTQVILTFSETIGSVDQTLITIMANSVTATTTAASATGTKVEIDLTTALTATSTTITVALAAAAVEDVARNGNLAVAATAVTNAVGTTAATCSAGSVAITGITAVTIEAMTDVTGLIADCNTLLELKDTLRGATTLSPDWAVGTAMDTWSEYTVFGYTFPSITIAGTPPRVTEMDLSEIATPLAGTLPPALGDLDALIQLSLRHHDLPGEIPPELGGLANLTHLYLDHNQFTGSIPAQWGTTTYPFTSLEALVLDNNQLTGGIPADLGAITTLRHVDLGDNQLTGSIPAALGSLANLEVLRLFNNQLTGSIPAQWGTTTYPLTNLKELAPSGNQLTGSIPATLGSLANLEFLRLFNNQLTGSIPAQWGTTTYPLTNLKYLSLSDNQLTGSIPAALGKLASLTRLDLRRNQISGSILAPAALGDLATLEWLLLNGNTRLSGPIPAALGDLANLQYVYFYDTDWTGIYPDDIPQALRDIPGIIRLWTNRRPRPPAVTDQVLVVGLPFDYPVAFDDPDTDTLTYHATLVGATPEDADLPLPGWLAIDAMTGTLSGTPSAEVVGQTLMVRVTATDEDVPPDPPTDGMPFCDSTRSSPTENNPPTLCDFVIVTLTGGTGEGSTGGGGSGGGGSGGGGSGGGGSGGGGSGGGGSGGGGSGGGGSGGGDSGGQPPVVEAPIGDQTLDSGDVLELDISGNFNDPGQRALDYTVESADPSVAEVEVDRDGVVTMTGHRRGRTTLTVTVTAAGQRDETASQTFRVTVLGPSLVAFMPRASDPLLEGFLRVVNRSGEDAEITIEATDDTGTKASLVTLEIAAEETAHFNSGDLEDGNPDKGLTDGVGSGQGDWRLTMDSETDFDAFAYIRATDGFLTAMHDWVPSEDGVHRVAIFNPASNVDQSSRLRLANPGSEDAAVTITGIDDAGASPGNAVTFEIAAGNVVTLTASELESGTGLDGALGDGTGKWRLDVTANRPIVAMSLLSSPTGHLTNLSTVSQVQTENGAHLVPLFPSASDALGRQGFVRVVNRTNEAGDVTVVAFDDRDTIHEPLTLSLDADETVHFNSDDLELGNADKGLAGSTGSGAGDWRLELSSDLDIDVLTYIRANDGFLTSMLDVVPSNGHEHAVVIFNPGSNPNQVSSLRLINPGADDAEATIIGIDDMGDSPGGSVVLTVSAGGSYTVEAAELESGGDGLSGALGDGTGKWRLIVTSEQPLIVMSLLSSPTGHLTNLSTAPASGMPVADGENGSP